MKHLYIQMRITTAYHPSADGQSEQSNNLVEMTLQCLLIGCYEADWANILLEVEHNLNCLRSASTDHSSFKLMYGVTPRL